MEKYIENSGYVAIYRNIINFDWYQDSNTFRVYLHCILSANYTNKKWQGIEIQRGSFITSCNKIAQQLNLTEKQVRTSLMKLKRTNNLTCKATNKYTVITVHNYDLYQYSGEQIVRQASYKGQTNENQMATTNKYNNEIKKKNLYEKKNDKFEILSLEDAMKCFE